MAFEELFADAERLKHGLLLASRSLGSRPYHRSAV